MRWDSPFVLATAGTIAIHVILFVLGDAIVVYNPYRPPKPAPRIEMFEIEVPPPKALPPPPAPVAEPEPVKQPEPTPQRVVARTQTRTQTRASEPPPTTEPVVTDPQAAGGDPVVTLDSAATGGVGVPVAVGKRTSQRVGRGGGGGGTGTGSGSGAAPVTVAPMSVATIKKRALPKGDYGYFDAGKDYPPEARQLAIEGPIRVRLVVDDTGKVTSSVLLNRLGHGLDELAMRRASQIQFEPARDTDDRPVASVVVWTFNMTLPK
ncbi:MAG: TonB family protein [Myxococcales bacterium]|nr:TonB family protein [Myxococcales bacterium]